MALGSYVWNDQRISGTDRAAGHLCSMHYGKISGVFCKKGSGRAYQYAKEDVDRRRVGNQERKERTSAAKGRTAGTQC